MADKKQTTDAEKEADNLGDIEGRLKQNEDQSEHIDDTIDGLHKTVAFLEGRYVETVEKTNEVSILTTIFKSR